MGIAPTLADVLVPLIAFARGASWDCLVSDLHRRGRVDGPESFRERCGDAVHGSLRVRADFFLSRRLDTSVQLTRHNKRWRQCHSTKQR